MLYSFLFYLYLYIVYKRLDWRGCEHNIILRLVIDLGHKRESTYVIWYTTKLAEEYEKIKLKWEKNFFFLLYTYYTYVTYNNYIIL